MSETARFPARILLGALLLLGGVIAAADEPDPPVPTQIWDFGYVPQKSEVRHVFYLTNSGTEPLTVKEIKIGCSCTSASRIDEPIPPGDSAAIAVTFKSGRYYSIVKKTTKIYTQDPDSPEHHLVIYADVIRRDQSPPHFTVTPSRIEWELQDDVIAVERDSLLIAHDKAATFGVELISEARDVIERIDMPDSTIAEDPVSLTLHPSKAAILENIRAASLTFLLISGDTARVTVPIELKD
jgi:hypothetical protein